MYRHCIYTLSKASRLPPLLHLLTCPPTGPPLAPRHLVRPGQGRVEDQGGTAQDFPNGAAEPGEGAVAVPSPFDAAREERRGHAPGRRGAQAGHAPHEERLAVSRDSGAEATRRIKGSRAESGRRKGRNRGPCV